MNIIRVNSPEHQELVSRAQTYNDEYILQQLEEAEQAGAETLLTLGSWQDALKNANSKPGQFEIIVNPGLYRFINKKR